MLRGVGINAVCIEILSEHQHRFAVRIRVTGRSGEMYVCGEGNIAGYFLPRKIKIICLGPHIGTGRSGGVCILVRIVSQRPRRRYLANIRSTFEGA